MNTRTWLNRSQPQTLYLATLWLYINAALSLFDGLVGGGLGLLGLLLLALDVLGAYGVANEKKWGYATALVAATLMLLLEVAGVAIGGASFFGLLDVIFAVVLVILLVHPMSRDYYRVWFH
jgi:hypothetical protein